MTFIQNNPLSRRKSSPCNANGDEKTISEIRKEPGSSNAGKYPDSDKFCGPAGGAAKGSYPVEKDGKLDMGRISAAKSYADNAPDPSGIIACANRWEKEYEKEKGSVSRRSSSPVNYSGLAGVNESDWLRYGGDVIDETAQKHEGMSRHGSMTGDQSATKSDYPNYKGTDKGYHGHDGESHRDQSATRRDYMGNMGRHHIDPRTKR